MDKDIAEITRQWKSLNICIPAVEIDNKMDQYFEKYFMKYRKTIYQSALSLFNILDLRNIKKTYKHALSFQAMKYFCRFADKNKQLMDEAFWNVQIALEAFKFAISREHESWIKKICLYYRVVNVPAEELINVYKATLHEKKFPSAAWFALYADIVHKISIKDICVPLICQSRVPLVEQLMRHDKSIAMKVVECFDEYVDSVGKLIHIAEGVPGANFSILNSKAINKLTKRWAREHKIPAEFCPRTNHNANMTAIKFLIKRRYIELKAMDRETWETMMQSALDPNDRDLINELVYDLTTLEQYEEAKYWANLYSLPETDWPDLLLANLSNPDKIFPKPDNRKIIIDWDSDPTEDEVEAETFTVDIPIDKITFIDDCDNLNKMLRYLSRRHPLLAIDTEWKPNLGLLNEPDTTAALIQIACTDRIFVIDALTLRYDPAWQIFVEGIINNPCLTKIGFGIQNDLRALSGLLSHLDVPIEAETFIDYADFHNWLVQSFKIPLPVYPVSSGGLSKLSYAVLGKYLTKDDQYTNWEIRPLHGDKIIYAAIDAFVLLEIHHALEKWCDQKGMCYEVTMYAYLERNPEHSRWQLTRIIRPDSTSIYFPPTSLKDFKVLLHPSSVHLATLLRYLGVDAEIALFPSNAALVRLAWRQNRFYICNSRVDKYIKDHLPQGWTFAVDHRLPIYEKLLHVIVKFNLIVTDEFIYTRCSRCNYHHLMVIDNYSIQDWKERGIRIREDIDVRYDLVPEGDDVRLFYICFACGMVYWKGKYYELIRKWAKLLKLQGFGHQSPRVAILTPQLGL